MLLRIKIFLIYLLAGPMVGGLLVALAFAVSIPSFGELIGLIATCVFFAYPFGALAAACAGLTHAAMLGRVGAYAIAAATALAGLLGHAATLTFFGKGLKELTVLVQTHTAAELAAFVAPPLVSALIICYAILQYERLGQAARPSFLSTF